MKLPARCIDMNEAHLRAALSSTKAMGVLLKHMAEVARPAQGSAKILIALARMVTTDCDWLESNLHVEVTTLEGGTKIEIARDVGGGIRELMFPRLRLAVPVEEFTRAVKVAPQLVEPLRARSWKGRLVLTCEADLVGTIAPPAFEVAERCMRMTISPSLRRSLPPLKAPSSAAKDAAFEATAFGRSIPKAARAPVIKEVDEMDVGWDFGAYSSGVNTRETKPPPTPATDSTVPTRPPLKGEAAKGTRRAEEKVAAKPSREKAAPVVGAKGPHKPPTVRLVRRKAPATKR